MKNNLFWLLFGSTAIGLSICGLALYFSILIAMEQDQILDFAEDVQILRQELEQQCLSESEQVDMQTCVIELAELYNFDIQLSQKEQRLSYQAIERVGDKTIYDLISSEGETVGFQASMPLLKNSINQHGWLIVKDKPDWDTDFYQEPHPDDSEDLDIALTGAIYGTVILLIILAIFLYFPVRKLNRLIIDIQQASEQIGKKNYDVRLAEYNTQPLADLATGFNAMAEKIQNHIRDKNILANAIAHELRTPLTRFRLALGLLNRQSLPALAQELVCDLESYTDDLELITDNTLRLATLRESELHKQSIKLVDLINDLTKKFQQSFPTIKLVVRSQVCELTADAGFLQLALDNVLSNACHYAKSSVNLTQWVDGGSLFIEVCDDGPGIPSKDFDYIQQEFTRLDQSRNRQTGGAGLGLAIVRIAVQRLQGEVIFLESEQGAKIRLSLPLDPKD